MFLAKISSWAKVKIYDIWASLSAYILPPLSFNLVILRINKIEGTPIIKLAMVKMVKKTTTNLGS